MGCKETISGMFGREEGDKKEQNEQKPKAKAQKAKT